MKNYIFRFRNNFTNNVEGIFNMRDNDIITMQFDPDNYSMEQYSGMDDKNGTRIFENDIVGHVTYPTQFSPETQVVKGIIKYVAPSFVVYSFTTSRLIWIATLTDDSKNIQVLGDISHENVENLLH